MAGWISAWNAVEVEGGEQQSQICYHGLFCNRTHILLYFTLHTNRDMTDAVRD